MFKYDIKKRRCELGLTLEQVGKAVGVGKSTVQKWENGDIENMKRDRIALLAKALKISPSEFMGWEKSETTTPTDEELDLLMVYRAAQNSDKGAVKALISAIDKLLGISARADDE